MSEYHVNCITKPNRESRHEHITHVGNTDAQWRLTRESVIRRIDGKQDSFFTTERQTGARSLVGVVREPGKAPYLRTHANGKWNDNLLAQPECDAVCRIVE
jgi:hypothetical protein